MSRNGPKIKAGVLPGGYVPSRAVRGAVWGELVDYAGHTKFELGRLIGDRGADGVGFRNVMKESIERGVDAGGGLSYPDRVRESCFAAALVVASAPTCAPSAGLDDVVVLSLEARLWELQHAMVGSARFGALAEIAKDGTRSEMTAAAGHMVAVQLSPLVQRAMLWPKFEEVAKVPEGAIDLNKNDWPAQFEDAVYRGERVVVTFSGDVSREGIHYLVGRLEVPGDLQAMVQATRFQGVTSESDFGAANCANEMAMCLAQVGDGRSVDPEMRDFTLRCSGTMDSRAARRAQGAEWQECAHTREAAARRIGVEPKVAGVEAAVRRGRAEGKKQAVGPSIKEQKALQRRAANIRQLGA